MKKLKKFKVWLFSRLIQKDYIINITIAKRLICDSCGTLNPKTFPSSRVTTCCATTEKNFYGPFIDPADNKEKYGIGKTYQQNLTFVFKFYWI